MSESSTSFSLGGSESSRERKFLGTRVSGNESIRVLSLLGAKVRGNESSCYPRKVNT